MHGRPLVLAESHSLASISLPLPANVSRDLLNDPFSLLVSEVRKRHREYPGFLLAANGSA
jgi:hypothetical protein